MWIYFMPSNRWSEPNEQESKLFCTIFWTKTNSITFKNKFNTQIWDVESKLDMSIIPKPTRRIKEPQDNVSISKKTLKYVHVITMLTGMKHHLLISLLQWGSSQINVANMILTLDLETFFKVTITGTINIPVFLTSLGRLVLLRLCFLCPFSNVFPRLQISCILNLYIHMFFRGKISLATEKMLREYNSTINFNGYTERDLTSWCVIISILSISWNLQCHWIGTYMIL